jgi:deoxyribose-phosphate aldolase
MINKMIEYTKLNPTMTSKQVKIEVDLAALRGYRSIVLTYQNIGLARSYIRQKGYDLKVVVVLGFPSDNYNFGMLKTFKNDYDEVDMVLPIQDYYFSYPPYLDKIEATIKYVKKEMESDVLAMNGKPFVKGFKLILETAYMRAKDMQVKELCELAKKCEVNVIKTNTGLIQRKGFEDLLEDVNTIKKYWQGDIKASGGIKKLEDAEILIKAGATLIGTSSDLCAPIPEVVVPTAISAEEKK